ncbi:MAG: hypothetical protein AABW71_03505 [Nanoarchaeota archaeon]
MPTSQPTFNRINEDYQIRRLRYKTVVGVLATIGFGTGFLTIATANKTIDPYSQEVAVVQYEAVNRQKESLTNYKDSLKENNKPEYIGSELERLIKMENELKSNNHSIERHIDIEQNNIAEWEYHNKLGLIIIGITLGITGAGMSLAELLAERRRMRDWSTYHERN